MILVTVVILLFINKRLLKQRKKKIILKSNLVLLNDIPKTLCLNLTLTENCDFFNGINLLETNSIGDTPYYVFISRNEKPNCCAIKNF